MKVITFSYLPHITDLTLLLGFHLCTLLFGQTEYVVLKAIFVFA